jgi:hypothetical protein
MNEDRHLQAASYYILAYKRSMITTLMDRANSVTRPPRPQNYMLGSFSKPMATPCRILTERLNPELPREVSGKQTTEHTSNISEGPLSSRLLQKHNINTFSETTQQKGFQIQLHQRQTTPDSKIRHL